ncbi:MAG: hypothetical protein WAM82_17175 [Thermoanaerobaculia bacterium]
MIVADFLTDPRSEPARLLKMLDLLGKGSGDQLKRSEAFGEQAEKVARQLPAILRDSSFSSVELRTVLGWTSRLLQVRSGKYVDGPKRSKTPHSHGLPNRPPGNHLRPTKPQRPVSQSAPLRPAPVDSRAPEPPNWNARIQSLGWGNADRIVPVLLAELTGDIRREAAKAIIEKMGGKREFRAKKDKPWVQELFEAAGE